MASAAAVAADSMESPLDETTTADGAFTASVRPRDSATPAGSDIAGNGANGLDEDGEAGDLFGDDADDDGVAQ